MHNKVGRQAFVCVQAGRWVDTIIIRPSIPRRYIKLYVLYYPSRKDSKDR